MKVLLTKNIPNNRRYTMNDDYGDIKSEFEIDDNFKFEPFVKDHVYYSPCQMNPGKFIMCNTFEFDNEIDHEFTENVVCPYCGYNVSDCWELQSDSADHECEQCKSTFEYERVVTVDYTTSKKKKNNSIKRIT